MGEGLGLGRSELGGELGEVYKTGLERADGEVGGEELGAEFFEAEGREGGRAAEDQHGVGG